MRKHLPACTDTLIRLPSTCAHKTKRKTPVMYLHST